MTQSRREFIRRFGIAGGAMAIIGPVKCLGAVPRAADSLSHPLTADELEALAGVAFNHARTLGCSYAGVLIRCSRTASVLPQINPDSFQSEATSTASDAPSVIETANIAFTVRITHSGARGFARSPTVIAESFNARKNEIARLTELAVADAQANAMLTESATALAPALDSANGWATPRRKHTFNLPARAQRAFRRAVKETARKLNGATTADSGLTVSDEETFFVSTDGAYQHGHRLSVG